METKKIHEIASVTAIREDEFVLVLMGDGSISKIRIDDILSTPISFNGSKNYMQPIEVLILSHPNSGPKTVTITICKCESRYQIDNFKIFTVNNSGNALTGSIEITKTSTPEIIDQYISNAQGCMSNVRIIDIEDTKYIVADVSVQQFGSVRLYLQGICYDVNDIFML